MSEITLIKNGLVFTGELNKKASIKHILIKDKVIELISDKTIEEDESMQVIDAKGKWVTPGFIDTHTHYDAEVIAEPGLFESARHGVTSVILGSCSVSAIYNNPEDTSDFFARVEAIPREILFPLLEEKKVWDSPKTWIEFLNQQPLGINVASYIGHSDIRSYVMGIERSLSENEEATEKEQAKMLELLREAMDDGFIGLSTMDNPWDKMDGDKYWSRKTPSFYSSWKERKPLINELRKRNRILQGAPNLVTRVNAIQYMIESTGLFRKPLKTTIIALMDLMGDRFLSPIIRNGVTLLNVLLRGNIRMQSNPCPFTVYYEGVDSVMFEEFPSGEAMRHLAKNLDERNQLIREKGFRDSFKKEIKRKFAPKVWHKDLSIAFITKCPDETLVGKNFFDLAEEKGEHPVDTFLDLIIEYDKKIQWTTTIANDRPEKYKSIFDYKYNVMSFSDAGAHLNNMAFYDFPLQMICQVNRVLDTPKHIMTLEKCIWRLTGELSDWFGLGRGYIKENKPADIVIIDPDKLDTISNQVEEAPIEGFNNQMRLVNRHPDVVTQVFVNGKNIYKNNTFIPGYGQGFRTGEFIRCAL